jgi:LCP family protein required for cell wall assembly
VFTVTSDSNPVIRRRPTRTKIILRWVAIAVVLIVVVAVGYVWYNYQSFVSGITHINAITSTDAPKSDIDGSAQNILLVGDDHRPAGATAAELAELGTQQDGGGDNTDTMMILHIAAGGGRATLISLPRDSWVNIPGYGMNKLNAAFSLGSQNGGGDAGGAKLLIKVVQNITGLTIDHFVRVSLLGFYNIAKALGPVQVCLNEAVDDPYSTLVLPAGTSTLDAQQALAFVRQRHGLPQGDLDRVIRQQYFLSIEAHKILSAGTLLNPVKLKNVLNAVSSSIQTDPGLNLLNLAGELHGLTGSKITSATIPVSGTPTIDVNGTPVSIVQIDTAAMPAFINSVIGTPSESAYSKAKASPVKDVKVTVLNGSDTDGIAATNTATLSTIGFKTGTPGSTATSTTTTIEYAPGKEGDAKALAHYIPGAALKSTDSVSDVTLILGTDGLQVTPPGAAPTTPPSSTASSNPSSPAKSYSSATCID